MRTHEGIPGAVPEGVLAGTVLRTLEQEDGGFSNGFTRKPISLNFLPDRKGLVEKSDPAEAKTRLAPLARDKSLVVIEPSDSDSETLSSPVSPAVEQTVFDKIQSKIHKVPPAFVPQIFTLPTITMTRVVEDVPERKPDIKETTLTVSRTPQPSRFSLKNEFPVAHLADDGEVSIHATQEVPAWIRKERKEHIKKGRAKEVRTMRREFLAWKERQLERQARINEMKRRVRETIRRKEQAAEVRDLQLQKRSVGLIEKVLHQQRENLKISQRYDVEAKKARQMLPAILLLFTASTSLGVKFWHNLITFAELKGVALVHFGTLALSAVSLLWFIGKLNQYSGAKKLQRYYAHSHKRMRTLTPSLR